MAHPLDVTLRPSWLWVSRLGLAGALLLAAVLPSACGDDDSGGTPPDASFADVAQADTGPADPGDAASPVDADVPPVDADAPAVDGDVPPPFDGDAPDASVPDTGSLDASTDGIGPITGACGELDDVELLDPGPSAFRNAIALVMGFSETDARLSEGAREILADGTAGGSSGLSEALAFEVLHRCEGALLIKSETEIVYDPIDSNKTDILVEIDGHRVGVSVTRAIAFPFDSPYPVERAQMLLEGKLLDVLESSMNVVAADAWIKQVLHVIAYGPMHAESILSAWDLIDPSIRADTILYVTVTDGDDAAVY
ncbi:MAG: hypothetical protein IT379_02425 [Deltaproteobacteria bacterium]|nr:hypothetical protein [Deltaproteobacteria bacterium]